MWQNGNEYEGEEDFCVVAYDISDDKRRNKVARILTRHGKESTIVF